jgi:hypothetical protein
MGDTGLEPMTSALPMRRTLLSFGARGVCGRASAAVAPALGLDREVAGEHRVARARDFEDRSETR